MEKPSRILVVEPMSSGLGLLHAARSLGIETIAVSFDRGDRELPGAIRDAIDTLLITETNDEQALTATILAEHARQPLSGIVPGFEFYVDSVARIAAGLGLPGLPPDSVSGLRDKAVMRQRADAAGLRVPRFAPVPLHRGGEAALDTIAKTVGFPAVLKPARAAGSVHVTRCDSPEELRRAYAWMLDDPRTDLGRGLGDTAMVEEYVPGPEISVEGYVHGGDVVVVALTDKILGPEPMFVEIGHIVEAAVSPFTRNLVTSFVADVCRVLDLTTGVFHCELRLPQDQPVLIEIGARLSGDHITDLVELVTGVSLARVMLACATGLPLEQVAAPTAPAAKCAGIHFLTAPGLDTLHAVTGLEQMAASNVGVRATELYLAPGEPVPPAEDFRSRIGHVIFTADSHAEAMRRRDVIAREVRIA